MTGFAAAIDQLEDAADALESDVVYAVGTPHEYGIWQEIGTARHPPQPYMRPATNRAQRRVKVEMAKANDMDEAISNLADIVLKESKKEAPVRTGQLRDSIHKEKRK